MTDSRMVYFEPHCRTSTTCEHQAPNPFSQTAPQISKCSLSTSNIPSGHIDCDCLQLVPDQLGVSRVMPKQRGSSPLTTIAQADCLISLVPEP